MRRTILSTLAAILLAWPLFAQQQEPKQEPKQESVAEAARKAREKKKTPPPKSGRVFTNDNLPAGGRVSVVGEAAVPPAEGKAEEKKADSASSDEAEWRGRFAEARRQLRQAEKELDILQRELNLLQTQYYSDPQKTLKEEFDRGTINEQRRKIEDKQKEVQQLRQALTDLEEQLRRDGKPAAWGREP